MPQNSRIGNYMLTKLIGEGGFSEVFLGEHLHIPDQKAAIKIPTYEEYEAEFLQEAAIASKLHGINTKPSPPHIAQVIDFGVESGTSYLIMEYAPNGTLRQRHPKGEQVPLEAVVGYIKQLAKALQYAHDHGVIHLDVKPENMLLNIENELLLSDFGIAEKPGKTPYNSAPKSGSSEDLGFRGTLPYMGPERFEHWVMRASDQYALGIVAYEWLCGYPPFQLSSLQEMGRQHREERPPSFREQHVSVSPDIERVVMRTLAKESKRRYRRVQDFAEALEQAYLKELKVDPSPSRRWVVGALLTAAAVVLVGTTVPGLLMANASYQHPSALAASTPTSGPLPPKLGDDLFPLYTGLGEEVTAVAISTDSKRIAAGGTSGKIQILDLHGTPLLTHHSGSPITSLSWLHLPSGDYVLSTSERAGLQIWNAKTKKVLPEDFRGLSIYAAAWSPDGKHVAVIVPNNVLIYEENSAHIGDTLPEPSSAPYGSNINTVAWSPDNIRVAFGSDDGTITIFEAETSKQLKNFQAHGGVSVQSIAWSPGGKYIVSGGNDNFVKVWNAASGIVLFSYQHDDSVNSVAWLPHSTRVVSSSDDKTVQIWDVLSRTRIHTYRGHTKSVNTIACSPDGKFIISGSDDGTVRGCWAVNPGPNPTP